MKGLMTVAPTAHIALASMLPFIVGGLTLNFPKGLG